MRALAIALVAAGVAVLAVMMIIQAGVIRAENRFRAECEAQGNVVVHTSSVTMCTTPDGRLVRAA